MADDRHSRRRETGTGFRVARQLAKSTPISGHKPTCGESELVALETTGRRRTTNPSEFNCPTWPSPLSARYQASAITNTFFRPSPTHGSNAISKDPTHGILGSGSGGWRSWTGAGIEDNIIGLLTGHKSRELRRYQHLREELRRKTVDLIAGVLKEAEKNGKGISSSRLLHDASKKANPKPKKQS